MLFIYQNFFAKILQAMNINVQIMKLVRMEILGFYQQEIR